MLYTKHDWQLWSNKSLTSLKELSIFCPLPAEIIGLEFVKRAARTRSQKKSRQRRRHERRRGKRVLSRGRGREHPRRQLVKLPHTEQGYDQLKMCSVQKTIF